jgi:signal transduction histidine kinase
MRLRPDQRVLVLSAASDTATRVRCLELGAADFVPKPFELAELVARVGAQLRTAPPSPEAERHLRAAGLTLDLLRRRVDLGDGRRPVELSEREFDLLRHVFPQWQTVPFHWIWITITVLYGYRRWSNMQTAFTLLAVAVLTTVTMLRTPVERAELSEVPLMSGVFLAMVWHVRRRQEAVDEQCRIAEREREFMRDAAHSLRTPLTVARGHAEFLLDGLEPGTQNHDDGAVMLDELRRLSRIADQLLLLSAVGHADALLLAPV